MQSHGRRSLADRLRYRIGRFAGKVRVAAVHGRDRVAAGDQVADLQRGKAGRSNIRRVPNSVVPSKNSTVPEIFPAPGLVTATWAVSVICSPYTGEAFDELSVVVVEAWLTTCVAWSLLVAKLYRPSTWP